MNKTRAVCPRCGTSYWVFEGLEHLQHRCNVVCVYRGLERADIKVYCRTCGVGGEMRVPIFDCAVHDACALAPTTPDPDLKHWTGAVCLTCEQFEASPVRPDT